MLQRRRTVWPWAWGPRARSWRREERRRMRVSWARIVTPGKVGRQWRVTVASRRRADSPRFAPQRDDASAHAVGQQRGVIGRQCEILDEAMLQARRLLDECVD